MKHSRLNFFHETSLNDSSIENGGPEEPDNSISPLPVSMNSKFIDFLAKKSAGLCLPQAFIIKQGGYPP